MNALRRGVDPERTRDDDAGANTPGEWQNVDLEFLLAVLARDEPRYHARVHGDRPIHNQRDPSVRQWLHGEALEHLDVGVAAADEDEIGLFGGGGSHGHEAVRAIRTVTDLKRP